MMKKLVITIVVGIIFFSIPLFSSFGQVAAATLKFDKNTYNANPTETLQVGIILDAGQDTITSTDIYVTYDATVLSAQSVTDGTFFPNVSHTISSGRVYIGAMVNDPATGKTGSGTVATIAFKALVNGTTTLAFDCQTGSASSSKIIKNDINATNVINCSQNGNATVTVGAGSTTSSNSPTRGPAPSSLPRTGIFDNLIKYALPGGFLLVAGLLARIIFL